VIAAFDGAPFRLSRAAAAAVWLTSIGCGHSRSEPSASSSESKEPVASPARLVVPGELVLARARCTPGHAFRVMDDESASGVSGGSRDEVEIGDAVADPSGIATGVVHQVSGVRTAAVAWLPLDAKLAVRWSDLGPAPGDAPPPRLLKRYNELLAAAYDVADPNLPPRRTRALTIYAVTALEPPSVRARIPQAQGDSFAFDMASSGDVLVAVWDEATSPARGVIRSSTIAADGSAVDRALSPADSDAEAPRVVVTPGGFTAFWLARRSESSPGDGSAGNGGEVTGEPRAFGWVESIPVDARGAPAGLARRITATNGHVSAYDARALDDGSVLVVARDDGESTDGSGGSLLRVRVAGDSIDPPLPLPTDGLGRGAPVLVDGRPLWLSWIGHDEGLRLLPLDSTGVPAGPLSAEVSMNDGRPLLVLSAPSGTPGTPDGGPSRPPERVLVASPGRAEGPLSTFECAR